jgi:prepilin-type N-terminal cleavage/methylation domain-containing protein
MCKPKPFRGFTLIEILVVVALIAILTAITFIAINPAKNFADTRNAQRSSDVTQILNAVTQYTSEQGHSLATFRTTPDGPVPGCNAPAYIGTDNVSLAALVDAYIVGIPLDPQPIGTAANTGYTICQINGRVQISAPRAELGKVITVKR